MKASVLVTKSKMTPHLAQNTQCFVTKTQSTIFSVVIKSDETPIFYLSSGLKVIDTILRPQGMTGDVLDGPLKGDGYNLVIIPANSKHKEG